jgi:small-conductance mechanosensitive channel
MSLFLINVRSKLALRLVFVLALILLTALITACGTQPAPPTATATATAAPNLTSAPPAPETTSAPTGDSGGSTAGDVAQAVASRTPAPTPTPGIIDQEIDNLTNSLGLTGKTFLGLTVDDWFSLAFSVLIVALGYFLGFKLLVWFLKWIARRTSRKFDGSVLKDIESDLKLLLLVFFTRFAVLRLNFLSVGLRTATDDLFFVVQLVLLSIIAIRLINYTLDRYIASVDKKDDQDKLAPVIKTAQRLGDFVVLIIAGSIGVSHFGVGGSSLAAAMLFIGVIIYLGAKGIISDFVAGFIILIDQPFRVGDGILLKDLDTWGDVLQIGTRTTRIKTKDNREVIIPNSQISQSQVINYTYPDPKYRVQTDIGVAYGTDFDQMRQVLEQAVRGLDGVLADKPVEALFIAYGDSTRTIRVRWWVEDYHKERHMIDKVNAALEVALDKAGIDMPFDTYNLNVKMQDKKPVPDTQDDDQDNQVDST